MATLAPGLRKAFIAGGIAVALSAAGGAAVWAGTQASQPPSPTSSSTPAPSSTRAPGPSSHGPSDARGGQALHGAHVVKDANGSFRTIVTQSGSIESVSGSEVTVKSEDGFTQRYAINGDTRISKVNAETPGKGRGKPALPAATAADLKVGDAVRVSGTKNGDAVTAGRIVSGEFPAMNRMFGHGPRGHGPK